MFPRGRVSAPEIFEFGAPKIAYQKPQQHPIASAIPSY
jgi:hypothetical protein